MVLRPSWSAPGRPCRSSKPRPSRGRLIEERVLSESSLAIDDAGEAADVVEILQGEHEVLFRLYHCKYAHSDKPGVRMADLYEECGQAIRSSRRIGNPEALLLHLERRETGTLLNGRPKRFEKGEVNALRKLGRAGSVAFDLDSRSRSFSPD